MWFAMLAEKWFHEVASEVANRFQRMGKYRQICLSKFGLILWFAFLPLRLICTDTFVCVGLDCSACFAFSNGIYALQLNGASRSNVRPGCSNLLYIYIYTRKINFLRSRFGEVFGEVLGRFPERFWRGLWRPESLKNVRFL